MHSDTEDETWWLENCSIIPPEELRFFLVGILGTFIATVSFVFNVFLFGVLVSNRQNRQNNFIYLIFLALIDSFLSASYVLLFSVNIFMDSFESDFLAFFWWRYLRMMLTISHVAITSSALLLTLATFERFITISKIRSQFPMSLRLVLTGIAISFALIAKAPMFFELDVIPNENCTGVTEFVPQVAQWSEEEPYKTVYKFWFRNIVSTFLPFLFSLYFNMRIVRRLREQHTGARLFRFATSEHRVFITSTYLCCNILSVIIATIETINKEFLMMPEIRDLYTYSTDLISLLTVFSCSSRLPIYYACNRRIRRKVNKVILRFCYCGERVRRMSSSRFTTMRCLNSQNGGFVLYAPPQEGHHMNQKSTVFGTSVDKVVLQVAMNHWGQQAYTTRQIHVTDNDV
ncbi:hypothetical protein M3Y97_00575400 [Aphelenchoides bicaudatus]|nr:hypothetical protein M3Y97_00575400 [Aphelenchoides bicaudatus]